MSLEIQKIDHIDAMEVDHDRTQTPFPEFMWLEVTGACQLSCNHCYAESGPQGNHGSMTEGNWHTVIDDSADLGLKRVQFIGGEPTLLPSLPGLVDHALGRGVSVEVYSNLTHIRESLWQTLSREGVSLATSFYSDTAAEHEAITRQRGSYERTRLNIAKATDLGIPMRVGLVDMHDGQRITEAKDLLVGLGVQPENMRVDRLREVGRGRQSAEQSIGQLCGRCTVNLAVGSEGQVWPCVFSRWFVVGNVQEQPIAEIVSGSVLRNIRGELDAEFAGRIVAEMGCDPSCSPYDCDPYDCGPYQ